MKEIRKALENKIKCYKAVLDKISSGVIMVDAMGAIFEYNRIAAELEAMDSSAVIGKTPPEVYTPKETFPKEANSYLLRVQKTKKPILSNCSKYINLEGETVELYQSYFPILAGTECIGSFSILDEVTILDKLIRQVLAAKRHSFSHEKSEEEFGFDDIIGKNKHMLKAIDEARNASLTDANILITGETGTGKELFVRAMHNYSRKGLPFVPINYASIPSTLMESILFGSVKGAFTGSQNTEGLFEAAQNGTLFLDELNSMNIDCQSKLLRAIQERKIRKVGSTKEIPISCRIVAAINVDPLVCIEQNTLREDLFYRLSAACIFIPPLRERKDDIKFFLQKYNAKYNKNIQAISNDVYSMFVQNNWKGNVRELENIIEGMFIMTDSHSKLDLSSLSEFHMKFLETENTPASTLNLQECLSKCEREIICEALRSSSSKRQAAIKLGITPQSLNYKMKKFDL